MVLGCIRLVPIFVPPRAPHAEGLSRSNQPLAADKGHSLSKTGKPPRASDNKFSFMESGRRAAQGANVAISGMASVEPMKIPCCGRTSLDQLGLDDLTTWE